MDYKPMNQPISQPVSQPVQPTAPVAPPAQTSEHISPAMWYGLATVVVIALVAWYFYASQKPVENTETTAVDQTQTQTQATPSPAVDTTSSISAELNAIPDDSSALNQEQAASAAAVGGF